MKNNQATVTIEVRVIIDGDEYRAEYDGDHKATLLRAAQDATAIVKESVIDGFEYRDWATVKAVGRRHS